MFVTGKNINNNESIAIKLVSMSSFVNFSVTAIASFSFCFICHRCARRTISYMYSTNFVLNSACVIVSDVTDFESVEFLKFYYVRLFDSVAFYKSASVGFAYPSPFHTRFGFDY